MRRKDDDAKSGVGAQRGKGMHQAYVKEQEASMQHHYGGLPGVPPTLPGVSGHTRSPSSNEPLTPTSKDSSVNEANHSVSTTSTTSSFLSRHFRKRFFILKSHTEDDLRLSRERGLWATQPHNEIVLDQAFRTAADGVFLIFSANKSGEFFGYARMTGPIFITPDDALRAASGSGSTSLRAIPEDRTASANNLGAVPFAASPKPISGTNSPAVATAAQPSFLASRGASDPTPGRPPLEEPGARDSAPSAVPASVLTAWNQLSLGSTKSNGAKPDEDGITRRDTALTAEERNARLEELAEADDDAGSMAAAAQIQRASAPSVSVEAPPGDASEEKKTIAAGGQQGSQSSFGPGWGRPFQLEWVTTCVLSVLECTAELMT